MTRPHSKRIIGRLPTGRIERPRDHALAEIASGLPLEDAAKLAELWETEIGVPVGLLRCDDSLQELLAPFDAGNPLTWLVAESALEDGTGEVQHQLLLRREVRGWPPVRKLETIRDLFVAWCRA